MKVCDITEFYAESSGGVRTYIAAKARFLSEQKGWRHVLIVPGPDDAVEESGRSRTYRVKGPLVPFCAPYRALSSARKIGALLARERPDVVEIGSPYLAPWLTRRALRDLAARPAVVGFHHSDFPRTLADRLGGALSAGAERFAWRYARRLYGGFAVTLAASAHAAAALVSHGIPRVHRVGLGVDLRLFHPGRRDPALRERLGLRGDETLLLYVGRLAPEKGIRTLLEAFRLLPRGRYRLWLVGDGPCRHEAAAFAHVHGGLLLHGHETDRERLASAYASSDLLVAPGRFETFGLAVLEAQASGLPVVAVRGGSTPEILGPGAGALAEPDDPAGLAAAIAHMAAGDRQRQGLSARAFVEGRYGWEAILEDLAALYEQLVRQSSAT